MKPKEGRSENTNREIAIAVVLWYKYYSRGKFDPEIGSKAIQMAKMLDVLHEYSLILPEFSTITITIERKKNGPGVDATVPER